MLVQACVLVLAALSSRATIGLASAGEEEGPPHVVSLEPEDGAEVDAKTIKKLVVVFDVPMNDRGWSLCGGGPNFPKFTGNPRFDTPKKLVVDVELEPGHEYSLGLNCPSAQNFRSAAGVALVPRSWSFSTLPAKLPDQAKQKAENKKSLEALQALLSSEYSHHDLRVRSWDKLWRENEPAILGAKTTSSWAKAVAKALEPAGDIHMVLRLGERVFATGRRAVDSLWRPEAAARYFSLRPAGKRGQIGASDDGIGYVMIPAWQDPSEIDLLEQALAGLRNVRALVVDVRPNSGGDELLAQRIAAWFVDGEPVYAKNRYRVKPGKEGFGPIQERRVRGNTDAAKQLRVPIAVLSSRYVMSSNESFVLMMRQAKDCTVVGQPTFGSSANPKPHELPNGVTIVVPSWIDLRPDGTCFEDEGLAPDVPVEVDPKTLGTKDPILEKALEVLREKLKT